MLGAVLIATWVVLLLLTTALTIVAFSDVQVNYIFLSLILFFVYILFVLIDILGYISDEK